MERAIPLTCDVLVAVTTAALCHLPSLWSTEQGSASAPLSWPVSEGSGDAVQVSGSCVGSAVAMQTVGDQCLITVVLVDMHTSTNYQVGYFPYIVTQCMYMEMMPLFIRVLRAIHPIAPV